MNETLSNVFYTRPEDWLIQASAARDYATAVKRKADVAVEDLVKPILTDIFYMGYCAEINLEVLREDMIKRGETNENERDFDFTAIFWIKVCIQNCCF